MSRNNVNATNQSSGLNIGDSSIIDNNLVGRTPSYIRHAHSNAAEIAEGNGGNTGREASSFDYTPLSHFDLSNGLPKCLR